MWTRETIEDRIKEAVDTLERMPTERPAGYGSCMPAIVRSKWESFGFDGDPWGLYNERAKKYGPPTSEAIDRTMETITWLKWLSWKEREIIIRRAKGERWFSIEGRFKRTRGTLDRLRKRGLDAIVHRMNTLKGKINIDVPAHLIQNRAS